MSDPTVPPIPDPERDPEVPPPVVDPESGDDADEGSEGESPRR